MPKNLLEIIKVFFPAKAAKRKFAGFTFSKETQQNLDWKFTKDNYHLESKTGSLHPI